MDFHLRDFSAAIWTNGTLLDYCLECLTSYWLEREREREREANGFRAELMFWRCYQCNRQNACRNTGCKYTNLLPFFVKGTSLGTSRHTHIHNLSVLTLSHPPTNIKAPLMYFTGVKSQKWNDGKWTGGEVGGYSALSVGVWELLGWWELGVRVLYMCAYVCVCTTCGSALWWRKKKPERGG